MNLPIYPPQHQVAYFQLTHKPLPDIFTPVKKQLPILYPSDDGVGNTTRCGHTVRWAIDRQHRNRLSGPGGHWKRNACYERIPNIMGGTFTGGGSSYISRMELQ